MEKLLLHVIQTRPITVILAGLLLVLPLASGVWHAVGRTDDGSLYLKLSNDYRVFFGTGNPKLKDFEHLQNTFSPDDNVFLALAPKEGNIFTQSNLSILAELTEAAWQLPHSVRVDSLINFQHIRANSDDILITNLVEDAAGITAAQIRSVRATALDEPDLRDLLISPDGSVAAVNVNVSLTQHRDLEVPEIARAARALVADFEARYPDIDIYLSGILMLDQSFTEAALIDLGSLVPLSLAVIFLLLFLFIRDPYCILAALSVIALSPAAAMGAACHLGIPLTAPVVTAPIAIMSIAVADCIHILTVFMTGMRNGENKLVALVESYRVNFKPVFLTSLTTAIGFLSMNLNDIPPFNHYGNITALGVMVAYLLSILLMPALILLLPCGTTTSPVPGSGLLYRLNGVVQARPLMLVLVVASLCLAAATGIPRNELSDSFVSYFKPGVDFRDDTDFIQRNLTGIYTIDYPLDAGYENGVASPEYLGRVEAFTRWLRAQSEVVHVKSVSDMFKRISRAMHGDDDDWYSLPESRELGAQYLLLYEMMLPYGLDLNNRISIDKSSARITVTFDNLTSKSFVNFQDRAYAWQSENLPESMRHEGTSASAMFAHISQNSMREMITNTLVALALISAVLIPALGSLKLGILSLIPNGVPLLMAFGLWGYAYGHLTMALSVVVGMTLGIIVDDTVHFISKYDDALNRTGRGVSASIEYCFLHVSPAMWVTSAALIAGFFVMGLSDFHVNAGTGQLSALTISLALLVDLTLLPALLLLAGDHLKKARGITP